MSIIKKGGLGFLKQLLGIWFECVAQRMLLSRGLVSRSVRTSCVRHRARLRVIYVGTIARMAHALAVSVIVPFAAVGSRSCSRSRRRVLAVSASDIT